MQGWPRHEVSRVSWYWKRIWNCIHRWGERERDCSSEKSDMKCMFVTTNRSYSNIWPSNSIDSAHEWVSEFAWTVRSLSCFKFIDKDKEGPGRAFCLYLASHGIGRHGRPEPCGKSAPPKWMDKQCEVWRCSLNSTLVWHFPSIHPSDSKRIHMASTAVLLLTHLNNENFVGLEKQRTYGFSTHSLVWSLLPLSSTQEKGLRISFVLNRRVWLALLTGMQYNVCVFCLLSSPYRSITWSFWHVFFTRIFVRNLSCWVPSSSSFLTGCYLQFANVMFLQKHFKIPATCLKSPLVIQEFRFICLLVEFLDVQVQVSIHEFHSTPEVGIPWILTKKYEVLLWGYRFDFKNGLKLLEGYLLEQFVLFF